MELKTQIQPWTQTQDNKSKQLSRPFPVPTYAPRPLLCWTAWIKEGDAERAVSLYEIVLSGCYEKVNEIDDSGGDLGSFF